MATIPGISGAKLLRLPVGTTGLGPVSETRQLMTGHEAAVISALGLNQPRRGWHIPCPLPAHNDKNPSFRVDEITGKYHCSCGQGDILDVVQALHGIGLIDACNWVRGLLGFPLIGTQRQETGQQKAERERRLAEQIERAAEIQKQRNEDAVRIAAEQLAYARSLYHRSLPIKGTIVPTYLASRGITCPIRDTFRFLPAEGRQPPKMVVPFGMSPETIGGVHLTWLLPDGSGNVRDVRGKSIKRTIGMGHSQPLLCGPVGASKTLFIAEGIEDALTVHQACGIGAWAAGTGNRLPGMVEHIPPPPEVQTVIVQNDGDDTGNAYAPRLAEAVAARGFHTFIHRCA